MHGIMFQREVPHFGKTEEEIAGAEQRDVCDAL